MSRGKKLIRKGVWHIGRKYKRAPKKKKKEKGGAIPFGVIASLAAPVLGEVAKPLLRKIFGRGRRRKMKRW